MKPNLYTCFFAIVQASIILEVSFHEFFFSQCKNKGREKEWACLTSFISFTSKVKVIELSTVSFIILRAKLFFGALTQPIYTELLSALWTRQYLCKITVPHSMTQKYVQKKKKHMHRCNCVGFDFCIVECSPAYSTEGASTAPVTALLIIIFKHICAKLLVRLKLFVSHTRSQWISTTVKRN